MGQGLGQGWEDVCEWWYEIAWSAAWNWQYSGMDMWSWIIISVHQMQFNVQWIKGKVLVQWQNTLANLLVKLQFWNPTCQNVFLLTVTKLGGGAWWHQPTRICEELPGLVLDSRLNAIGTAMNFPRYQRMWMSFLFVCPDALAYQSEVLNSFQYEIC